MYVWGSQIICLYDIVKIKTMKLYTIYFLSHRSCPFSIALRLRYDLCKTGLKTSCGTCFISDDLNTPWLLQKQNFIRQQNFSRRCAWIVWRVQQSFTAMWRPHT